MWFWEHIISYCYFCHSFTAVKQERRKLLQVSQVGRNIIPFLVFISVCFKVIPSIYGSAQHSTDNPEIQVNLSHFVPTVDEEPEEKPKKRRKRMKELPKEDSSDDGN